MSNIQVSVVTLIETTFINYECFDMRLACEVEDLPHDPPAVARPRPGVGDRGFDTQRELNKNLSGNGVYYTACSLLVILSNSCGKLHRQKGFDLILF